MRVIVTRPKHAARRTAERLARHGHVAVLLPLFAPSHDTETVSQALEKPRRAIAVTSAEAIRTVESLGAPPEHYGKDTVYTVGTATANAARAAGFGTVFSSRGAGGELADLIADQFEAENRPGDEGKSTLPVLYLAGHPRAPAFEQQLHHRNIPLIVAEAYRMNAVNYDGEAFYRLLTETPADVVLFYSRETARQFFEQPAAWDLPKVLPDCIFACLSPNIAAAIPQPFRERAVIAPVPDEENLFDRLAAIERRKIDFGSSFS